MKVELAPTQIACRRLGTISSHFMQSNSNSEKSSSSVASNDTAGTGITAPRVGFIGSGQMATALARGLVSSGFVPADNVSASDPYHGSRDMFQQTIESAGKGGKVYTSESNIEIIERSDVVVLAIKPQMVDVVLAEIKPAMSSKHLFVSICAGVTMQTILSLLGAPENLSLPRMVRVMPNTPALVGQGASAFVLGNGATEDDAKLVHRLLCALGPASAVVRLGKESLLDAVTGVSGSGPAYVYIFIEALADGGVKAGLPRDTALRLAAQTVAGAAAMVLNTEGADPTAPLPPSTHPGVLKDKVTSPGGTTITALHALEDKAFRGAVIDAVMAAFDKAKELGNN